MCINSILTKLIDRFDSNMVLHEDVVEYRVEESAGLQGTEPLASKSRTRTRTKDKST